MSKWDDVINAPDIASREIALQEFRDDVLFSLADDIKNKLGDGCRCGWALWAEAFTGPNGSGREIPDRRYPEHEKKTGVSTHTP